MEAKLTENLFEYLLNWMTFIYKEDEMDESLKEKFYETLDSSAKKLNEFEYEVSDEVYQFLETNTSKKDFKDLFYLLIKMYDGHKRQIENDKRTFSRSNTVIDIERKRDQSSSEVKTGYHDLTFA